VALVTIEVNYLEINVVEFLNNEISLSALLVINELDKTFEYVYYVTFRNNTLYSASFIYFGPCLLFRYNN
jgi:hypothetical protein